MATIVIVPKLGPYGSGPIQVGFEIFFKNLPGSEAEWNEFVSRYNGKKIELTLSSSDDVNMAV